MTTRVSPRSMVADRARALGLALLAALAGVLALASAAAAQSSAPAPRPGWEWVVRPTAEDLRRAYPARANYENVSGEATVFCVVREHGFMEQCRLLAEEPAGWGFGSAAVSVLSAMVVRPLQPGAQGAEVTINFRKARREDQEAPPSAMRITAPWAAAPSQADVDAVNPLKGRSEPFGHVMYACRVLPSGRLAKCDRMTAAPEGAGLENAAKPLLKLFRVDSTAARGLKDRTLMVAVHFINPTLAARAPLLLHNPTLSAGVTEQDLRAAYPAQARSRGIVSGAATLECLVGADYALGACRVRAETPGASGFGLAAIGLAPRVIVNRWTANGVPTLGLRVIQDFAFQWTASPDQ